jgi:hypothetical protein
VPLVAPQDIVLGALFVGSLASSHVAGVEQLDEMISPRRGGRDDTGRSLGRHLGRPEVAVGLSAATFVVGTAAGSATTARVGVRSLESLVLTGALTSIFKVGFGRARPDSGFEKDHFTPVTFELSQLSFPSGHTSTVFALATTLSLELGDEAPWVPWVAYPVAAWTGVGRILDQRHWLTDVVAGAAVGIFSARVINRLHREPVMVDDPASGVTPRLLVSSTGGEHVFGLSLHFN